jgi:hypothetical protein
LRAFREAVKNKENSLLKRKQGGKVLGIKKEKKMGTSLNSELFFSKS